MYRFLPCFTIAVDALLTYHASHVCAGFEIKVTKKWWRNNYLTELINICHRKQSRLRHGKHHTIRDHTICLFSPTHTSMLFVCGFGIQICLANGWFNVPIRFLLCFRNLLESIWFTNLRLCVIRSIGHFISESWYLDFSFITAVLEITVRCHGIIQVNLFMSTFLSKWNWMPHHSDKVVKFV